MKYLIAFILVIIILTIPVSGTDINTLGVDVQPLLINVTITLSTDITINPNVPAGGGEQSIISSSDMVVTNNTMVPLDVYAVDINSNYNNEFVSYNNTNLEWSKLGTKDTDKYIAFSMNSKDILPNTEVYLGKAGYRWSIDNKLTLNTDVKAGYSWRNADSIKKTYPVTLVFKVDNETINVNDTPFVENPKYEEISKGVVVMSADAEVPEWVTVLSKGFMYCIGEDTPTTKIVADSNFKAEVPGLLENQTYTFVAYVTTDLGTFLSEPELIYLIPAPEPTLSIDRTTVTETTANTGAISETVRITSINGTFASDVTGLIQVSNLPAGLGISISRINNTTAEISFTGNATNHTSTNNVSNANVIVDKIAIRNNKGFVGSFNWTSGNISFSFRNLITMSIDKTSITETTVNTGAFTDTFTVTLTGGTFAADMSTGVSISNIPAGLGVSTTRLSNTQIRVSLTGAATNHNIVNNVSNAAIVINASKLIDNLSSSYNNNLTSNNITFTFRDPTVTFTGFTADKWGAFAATVNVVGDTPTERGFIYIKDINNPTLDTIEISTVWSGVGNGLFAENVVGLEAYQTYYVRAYAKIGSSVFYSTNTINFVAPGEFKYRIDLDLLGASNTYQFYTSSTSAGGFKVNWGDEQTELFTATGVKAHSYTTSGIKDITIIADKLNFDFYSSSSSKCITEVYNPIPLLNSGTVSANIFRGQSYLTSIPSNLLHVRTNITSVHQIFMGCSSLVSISVELFYNNTKITNFESAFNGCTNLISIPIELFKTNTEATSFKYAFNDCTSLILIPSGLFNTNGIVEDFSYTFNSCTNLTGPIPNGLFSNNNSVTTFQGTFTDCINLTGPIPNGLFSNNPLVKSFRYTFEGCRKLTGSIPTGLFSNNTLVTTFESVFRGCQNLTGSIPLGLFNNNPLVTTFERTFYECYNLTGYIPVDLFKYNVEVTTFYNTFYYCDNLTGGIPFGLFNTNTKVTTFYGTFSFCRKLDGSIPLGLFNNNPLVISFERTFYGCEKLTGSIPIDLFKYNTKVTLFSSTFGYCKSLGGNIPAGLFSNSPLVSNFANVFQYCENLTGSIPSGLFSSNPLVTNFNLAFEACRSLIGSAPELWTRTNPTPTGTGAFKYLINLTNYASIPSNWK